VFLSSLAYASAGRGQSEARLELDLAPGDDYANVDLVLRPRAR
jgi:hypothetical protein